MWGLGASAADSATSGSPVFSPCQIRDLNGIAVYSAECTEFVVDGGFRGLPEGVRDEAAEGGAEALAQTG